MSIKQLDRTTFIKMVQTGASNLSNHKDEINRLNVFPVPDGDTGTNMNLSMSSGVKEMLKVNEQSLPTVIDSFVKGLLMGARGNSGVILSQLFRGFSQIIRHEETITIEIFAKALVAGVEVAYKSVANPVEGTILTVAKDAANYALTKSNNSEDFIAFLEDIVKEAEQSLKRTPDLLPILKEVGVVDSGGKGLLTIYEGFLAALNGSDIQLNLTEVLDEDVQKAHDRSVQSFVDIESIEFGYCTEFLVEFDDQKLATHPFDEEQFRNLLTEYGDSLLVVANEEAVKIHIHTEYPGNVMTLAQQYGDLIKIDIENMRKQYEAIVKEETVQEPVQIETGLDIGIITVSLGQGINDLMKSLGATYVIEGGQTMNPSTEDFLSAIDAIAAEHTIILPNNKNVLLAAEQAKKLTNKAVTIIPTTTIPQGISALFAFESDAQIDINEVNMLAAMMDVKTGLVTYATRDTVINNLQISKNAFIGINDAAITVTNIDKLSAIKALIENIVTDDDEIITLFFGADISDAEKLEIEHFLTNHYQDDYEIEIHQGDQPVYSVIMMIE